MILTVLGIAGLVYAGIVFMKGASGANNFRSILIAAVLGGIFFAAGISLIRNTTDRPT